MSICCTHLHCNSAKYATITCSVGTYTRSLLETLLKVHLLRDISRLVNQEVQWVTVTPCLQNKQCAPPEFYLPTITVKSEFCLKFVLAKATLSSDLAIITGINWVNIATIQAFIDLLKANSYKAETVTFILNDLITLNKMELQC